MMKILLNLFLLSIIVNSCGLTNESDLLGNDIRLFKGTPVWGLAKLVEKEDTTAMRELLTEGNLKIDYQESRFGKSLLNFSSYTNRINAARILLEFGADPNLPDTYYGRSAFIQSCGYGYFVSDGYDTCTELMELMLECGGDVNAVEVGPRIDGNKVRYTPLLMAASCCYEKVKILVEAGADINYVDEYNRSPLREASLGNKDSDEIMKYLLIEKGANPDNVYVVTNRGDTLDLLYLIEDNFTLKKGTEKYKNIQVILEYLKNR